MFLDGVQHLLGLGTGQFKAETEHGINTGSYIDAKAGDVTLRDYAASWIKGAASDPSSRRTITVRLESRILSRLGNKPLRDVARAATLRDWLDWLREDPKISDNYAGQLFDLMASILSAAVRERLIREHPLGAQGSIRRPKATPGKATAWDHPRVFAVRDALPDRYRLAASLAVALGLRQGEILGLSPDDIDTTGGVVHVRRQIRFIGAEMVFALPKGGKTRKEAGVTKRPRVDGMHALRHTYASVMLAAGVSVRELADYLGHRDPGFTLRVYTHLLPNSHHRAQAAIDGLYGEAA